MSDTFDKAVDMVARCNAEIKSLRKGNRDLQLHFDVLKADYDRRRHEVGRLQALISDAKKAIDADDVIAAYRILDSQPAPSQWRPIETAPKDGTEVLMVFVFEDGEVLHRVVWWDSSNVWPWRNEYTGLREQDAKAWMPLSPPPDHFADVGKMIELPPAPSGWRPDALVTAANAIIDFYNGPAEAKRPDIFQRLMQRLANALPPAPGDANA